MGVKQEADFAFFRYLEKISDAELHLDIMRAVEIEALKQWPKTLREMLVRDWHELNNLDRRGIF